MDLRVWIWPTWADGKTTTNHIGSKVEIRRRLNGKQSILPKWKAGFFHEFVDMGWGEWCLPCSIIDSAGTTPDWGTLFKAPPVKFNTGRPGFLEKPFGVYVLTSWRQCCGNINLELELQISNHKLIHSPSRCKQFTGYRLQVLNNHWNVWPFHPWAC